MKNKIQGFFAKPTQTRITISVYRGIRHPMNIIEMKKTIPSLVRFNAWINRNLESGRIVLKEMHVGMLGYTEAYYEIVEPQESFEAVSVSREDLDRLGFDTSKVEDSTMRRLASKVGDSLNSDAGAFYYAVEYNGEMLEIPRPNPRDYDDENEDFETRRREPDWSIGDDDEVEFDPIS